MAGEDEAQRLNELVDDWDRVLWKGTNMVEMSRSLVGEVNAEIKRAVAKWGKTDTNPYELANGVAEELLEVIHAVNHREGRSRIHEEVVHAIGVLVRLDAAA